MDAALNFPQISFFSIPLRSFALILASAAWAQNALPLLSHNQHLRQPPFINPVFIWKRKHVTTVARDSDHL